MPFSSDFNNAHDAIRQTVDAFNESVIATRLDDFRAAGRISEDLINELTHSDLCIADVTGENPNVMWEVGYATALHKPLILLQQGPVALPFDIKDFRTITYRPESLRESLRDPLAEALRQTIARLKGGNAAARGGVALPSLGRDAEVAMATARGGRPAPTTSRNVVYLWHSHVHEIAGRSKLAFWRFSFSWDYNEDRIRERILEVLHSVRVSAYVFYEVLGEYDIIVRFWIDKKEDLSALQEGFREKFGPNLQSQQYMVVRGPQQHWAWSNGEFPHPESITRVTERHVKELSAYNQATLGAYEASGTTNLPTPSLEPPEWVEDFLDADLIRPIELDRKGIRCFLDFGLPPRGFRGREREDAARAIQEACDSADETQYPNGQGSHSLYIGTEGTFTHFLVIAKAPDGDFYDFVRDMIFGIRSKPAIQRLGLRPYTQVCADREFRHFRDDPGVAVSAPSPSALLATAESQQFELKGTFSIDVNRLISTSERVPSDAMVQEISQTICGFLNSADGHGCLVVGALEPNRYRGDLRALEGHGAVLGSIASGHGWARVTSDEALRLPDEHLGILLGWEWEHDKGALKAGSYDGLVRWISDILLSRIDPPPVGLFEISQEGILGRGIICISVNAGKEWHWVRDANKSGKSTFFVRENASTRALSGVAAERYRRDHPRRG